MATNSNEIVRFKRVIEDIVEMKLSQKGITKYIAGIVGQVNEDGTVGIYIPPDTEKMLSNVLNKCGEPLKVGDSVEICTKNGKTNNAWVAVKHASNFVGDGIDTLPIGAIVKYNGTSVPAGYELYSLAREAITSVGADGNNTYSCSTAWGWNTYDLKENMFSSGTGFTNIDSGIKVGKNIDAVKITAQMMFSGRSSGLYILSTRIMRGDTVLVRKDAYLRANASGFDSTSVVPYCFNVQEGDVIQLGYSSDTTGDLTIAGGATYITVEEI